MSVPKTASGSIDKVCRPLGVTVITHDRRRPDYTSLAEYRAAATGAIYAFAFVRNPWDRVVSAFFHLEQGGATRADLADRERYLSSFGGGFEAFVHGAFHDGDIFEQIHFRPQYLWITDDVGALVTDFVGRFERLYDDFGVVCATTGIRPKRLPHQKRSRHEDYRTYYDEAMRDIVARAYGRDIEMFDYDF